MKYLILGSTSDIAKEYISHINLTDPTAEIITISRSIDSHITVNWDSKYLPVEPSKIPLLHDWDVFISFIGSQTPIGPIHLCSTDDIISGVNINFTYQFAFISECIPYRRRNQPCKLILFAGGGTNSAPTLYSTYISSKIALIKLTELLYAEYPDIHSTIIGPGWVKTKIHEPTLSDTGKLKTPHSYKETQRRFAQNDFVSIRKVITCISTILSEPSSKYAGRNISVQHDSWQDEHFLSSYSSEDSLFKLRRLS